MGILTFRAPQDGLEQIQKAVDLVSLVQEIVRNPNMGDTIQGLSQQLVEAQQLSDAKKQEALDAQEIITQSKEFLEEFEKAKAKHLEDVRLSQLEIEQARRKISDEQQALFNEKQANQEELRRIKTAFEDQTTQVILRENTAKQFYEKVKAREDDLVALKDEHDLVVKEFEDKCKQNEIDLATRITKCEQAEADLALERQEFEARKKRFEDALKG